MRFKILFLLISVITIFGFTNLIYTDCVGTCLTEKEEETIKLLPFYGYSFETSNKIYFILHSPCPYIFVNKEGKIEFIFKPKQFHPDNMVCPPFLIGKNEYISQYEEKYKYKIEDIDLDTVLFITKIPTEELSIFKVKDKLYKWTDRNKCFIKVWDDLESILPSIDKRLKAERAWERINMEETIKYIKENLNREIKTVPDSPPPDEWRIPISPPPQIPDPIQIRLSIQSEIIKYNYKFEELCPSYKDKEKIMIIYPPVYLNFYIPPIRN